MGTDELRERLAYLAGRLANAERLGKPAHIARCRERYDGLSALIDALSRRETGDKE